MSTPKHVVMNKEAGETPSAPQKKGKMRILHLIPGLSNASGPTQVVKYLTHYTVEAGHEATICHITGRDADPTIDFDPRVSLHGFPAQWLRYWGYSPALQQYLNEHITEYDLVHVHSMWLYPNLAAARAAQRHGIPYIIRPAGSLEPWCMEVSSVKKKAYLQLIERRILNRAAAIHAVSEQEAGNIARMGFRAPVVMVPNGIETEAFQTTEPKSELRRRWGLPADRCILLFLSRIHPKKNLELLGQVFRRLLDRGLDPYLVIAGPNEHEYARQIQQLYHSLGLDDHFRFVGEVAGQAKAEIYQSADCFVLPSHSENFGVVVLEAMAAGLPAIVSHNMPWAVLDQEKAGFWLPLEEDRWVQALGQLISQPQLRTEMSRRASALAETFDWRQINTQLLSAYRKILKNGKGR